MKQKKRDKKLARACALTLNSFVSHVPFILEPDREDPPNREFHIYCLKEYAELLKIITDVWE